MILEYVVRSSRRAAFVVHDIGEWLSSVTEADHTAART